MDGSQESAASIIDAPRSLLTPMQLDLEQLVSKVTAVQSEVIDTDIQLQLLDLLPTAILVIDTASHIRFVNQRSCDMIGISKEHMYGRSILDFVLVEDLDFAASLLNDGERFPGRTMGPCRVRYVDSDGASHWTQVWANATSELLGIDGYVITLTSESVRDVLATAIGSVTADDDLDRTLSAVALSTRAMPLVGRGVMLVVEPPTEDGAHRFRALGDWPIDEAAINAPGTPWHQALADRTIADVDDVVDGGLNPKARELLLGAGVRAIFVRPVIDVAHQVVGVLVVFREDHGAATSNQNDHLEDAVRLASLSFTQALSRRDLEHAAHRDGLTGAANRTAFNKRVERERRTCDVLFVDLDHFKTVNDTFGHQIGDLVVVDAAERIAGAVRRDDIVYRTGGDEFVVVCEANGDNEPLRIAMAERIVERLRDPFDVGGQRVRIGATVGIASGQSRDLLATIRAADAALYSAKERGGGTWAHAPAATASTSTR